jgi:hypothetical protein
VLGFLTKTKRVEQRNETWAEDRRSELKILLTNLDCALDDASEKLDTFHFEHCAFNGKRLVYVSEPPTNRVQLEQQERDLLTRRGQIQRERNSCMAELAELPKE